MKRSEVLDIIDGILIDHELPVLQGISKEILSKLESIGFKLTEDYSDGFNSELHEVPYEPEEGWDAYIEAQDRIDEARDFEVVPKFNSYTNEVSITRSQAMAEQFLQGKSFEEIAQHYNVTRERVRQCVAKERRRYQRQLEKKDESNS